MYDSAGNTTSFGTGSLFNFNQRGRMTSGNLPGNSATNYIYNAVGQLIEKSGYGGTTQLVYDEAGHLVGESSSSGALIEETIWMGDIPVATLRPSAGTVAVYYVHTDYLGTVRKVTRPSDNGLMWRWDPDTFGSIPANSNPAGLGTFAYNLGFPGQYYLPELGLYQNYFRDYDPQTGRYVESDPIGLAGGSYSTYAYTNNNPLSRIDPFGLTSICRVGSSYFDCGAEPPSAVGACEQAMMAGPYVTGWMPCSTTPPSTTDCGSGNSNEPADDPFSPLVPHVPATPQLANTNSLWGASTGLGGSFGGFDVIGCTTNGNVTTSGLSGYGGCGVGLGALAARWRWANTLSVGNPTGWGFNGQAAVGAFGGAGSLSVFLGSSGAQFQVTLGNGNGGTANVTYGYRGTYPW